MAFITSLQYVTPDGLDLFGHDDAEYHVKVNEYADDEYFEDGTNSNEHLNTITFGDFTFAGPDIKTLKLHYEIGLLTDTLAIDTLTAEVSCASAITVTRYTPITVRRGEKVMGVFYNGQIKKLGKNQYQIYAESAISLLDYDYHNGGVYSGETTGAIIAELMGNLSYTIHEDIASIRLYGYLPRDTRRNNLQQIILATGAAIRKGETDVINITVLTSTVAGTFAASRVFEDGDISTDTPITALQVTEHIYLESNEDITLYEEAFVDEKLITFPEPAHGLDCTGGTIMESSANHAVVQGAGLVKLTGKKYTHTTKIVTRGATSSGLEEKIYSVTNATLIGPMNSSSIADRLYKYALCNQTVKQDVLVGAERPGDLVTISDPQGEDSLNAAVKSFDYSLSNTMRAAGSFLVGYVPAGIATGYKNRVLIDSDGTWTVPDGVKDIRVVLIGGGHSGTAGKQGEPGSRGQNTNNTRYGDSGVGGIGGAGGIGGKVFNITMDVTPGAMIPITIGKGESLDMQPSYTLFGDVSSEIGIVGTYIDMMTGEQYAAAGNDGVSGADGRMGMVHDGVRYPSGQDGTQSGLNVPGIGYIKGMFGIGGGGAAGGEGHNGEDGDTSYNMGHGSASGGDGGAGADATIVGKNGTTYGCGGEGGHGGGGGGGGGDAYHPSSSYVWLGAGGAGGLGSKGGNGAPGCVIIYY